MKSKVSTILKVMTALVLAVLMMVGSVSNVVGAVIGTAGFDGGTALITSAEKGLEIAENANISESADEADAAESDLDFEENEIVRGMKDDLANVGANADLADTGATYYMLCSYDKQNPGEWSSSNYASSTDYTFSLSPSNFGKTSWETGKNYYVGLSSSTSVSGMYCQSGSVSCTNSGNVSGAYAQEYGNYRFAMFSLSTTNVDKVSVTVTVSGTSATYAFGTTAGSGGTSSSTTWHSTWQATDGTDDTPTIYYDNSITQWSSVKFIIGRGWAGYNQSLGSSVYTMEKVNGTDNIYKCSPSFAYYTDFYFINGGNDSAGWNADRNIQSHNGETAFTSPKLFDLGNSTYFFIGQSSAVGTTFSPKEILCYGASGNSGATTASHYTTYRKSVTNTSVDHGSVSVTWKNDSGTTQTINEGSTTTNILIGKTLTVTMMPDSGYAADVATVTYANNASSTTIPSGGTAFTSGSSNTTVTGAFTKTETTHDVTFSVSPSGGGTVSPNTTTAVGEETAQEISATPVAGYEFSSWTFGDGITGASTSDNPTTITTKTSGDYTVTANFTKKNLTVTKGTHAHGDFTVPTTAQVGDTVIISDISIDKGYTAVSFSTTPSTTINTSGSNKTFTMPGEAVTVNATYTAKSGNTITRTASPSVGGNLYTSSATTGTGNVDQYTTGNTIYARAKPNDAYTFTKFVITYGDSSTVEVPASSATLYNGYYRTQLSTNGSKFSDANDGSISVVAYFTKKPTHKVTVVSNNNALGTATASVTEAYEGQTVTLTPKEDTGSFSSWSVTSGGVTVSNNTFAMGSSDVVITATFVAYSGTSNFYYNNYGSDGQPASTLYGARMTEGKIGGQTYSYYHVTGRSETDQLFTVSYGDPANNGKVYFCTPNGWTDKHGWDSDPDAQFYGSDGALIQTWSGMVYNDYYDQDKCWVIDIPKGARKVQFRGTANDPDTSNWPATALFDLNDLAYHVDCIYLSSSSKNNDGQFSDLGAKNRGNTSKPIADGFFENFNGTGKYTNNFSSGGFNNHNATRGASHSYTKPNNLSESQRGDYYVLVLYNGKTYTINGETKTIDKDPEIIWLPELPDSGDTIKVYAKDGAIAGYGQTYADLADTTVLKADGTTSAGATKYTSTGNQTYEVYKAQPGETITIKTTIGLDKDGHALTSPTAASLRDKYYVRGFMVNGEVPKNTQITTADTTNGVYTLTYTVPEDYTGKYIEITPVYFLVDTSANPVVTFRATNFPKGQHNWGDTPYVYPFYGKLGGYNNSFGVYAGQPMFFYNGQYTMQIPQKSTAWAYDSSNTYGAASSLAEVNNITVSGVTMSNGYYDKVHKLIMGYGDNSASADHVQTYDYGDFYKIFNEKKPVDNIVFDFKYENSKDNRETLGSTNSYTKTSLESTFTNGFEPLKNFHGRYVDIFGKALSGDAADMTKTKPMYVVSIAGPNGSSGVQNIAGYYATEWAIFKPDATGTNYTRVTNGKTSIPPEVLVLNDDDTTSFNNTTYPSADANHTLTDWKALYTTLEQYRDIPVMITYESAQLQIGSSNYAETGSGGATRNDGRWLYSKTGESITSKIKIQYSDDNGTTWIENPASGETGHIDGLSAYFTNTEVYGKQTYATTIDPDKTFDFEAKTTNANYKFVGWYMDDDNKTQITTDNDGSTERSGSYTFIARFKLVTSGQLILSHSVDTDTIGGTNYDGAGTVTIGAVVKDGDGNTKKTYAPSTSDITIDNADYINSDSTCTIDVTLTATRGNNSALGTTLLATPSGQDAKFFDYGDFTLSADGKTRTYTFTVNVSDLYTDTTQTYKNLIYHSYFKNYVFNYTVNYEFTARDGQQKIYNRAGTLTAPEAETYIYKQTVNNQEQRWIKKEFFESIAPYESNFQQSMTWNISDSYFTQGTNYVYTCNAHFTATSAPDLDKLDVTFVLPYEHTNGVATLTSAGVGTAATATNYAMIKESDSVDNRVTFGEIPVLTGERTNDIYAEEEKSHWIAAPLELSDGTFFSHWSVKTTDTNTEVARCYFPGFNFLAYDNYEITAVYGTAPVDMSTTGVKTAVTYLDTTRNQWNALSLNQAAAPDVPASDKVNAGDILYNDFILSYNYNGVEINQGGSDTNDITELGIVVERIKELDKNSDDTYDTRISSYTGLAQDTTKITNAATTAGDANGQKTIKDTATGKQYYKQSINKTALDNKDRIVFFEAFSNTAGWNSEKQRPVGAYSYKKYVYRAYTYITYNDGGTPTTVLSETPAYFIMYDIATADYSAN